MAGGEFEAEVAVVVGVGEDRAIDILLGGIGELALDDVVVNDGAVSEDDGGREFFSGGGPGEDGQQLDVGDLAVVIVPDVQFGGLGDDLFDLQLASEQAEGIVFDDDIFGGEDEVLLALRNVLEVIFDVGGEVDAHFFYADFAEQFEPGLIDFDTTAGEDFERFDGLQADAFLAGGVIPDQSDGDEQQEQDGGGDFPAAPVMW